MSAHLDEFLARHGATGLFAIIVGPAVALLLLLALPFLVLVQRYRRVAFAAIQARRAGRFDEAERLIGQLFVIARIAGFGFRGPLWSGAALDLALLYLGQRRFAEATKLVSDVLAHVRGSVLQRRLESLALTVRGELELAQGRREAAESFFARSIEVAEKVRGKPVPSLGTSHVNLGEIAHAAGRLDDAAKHFEVATTAIEAALGPSSPVLVRALLGRASVAAMRGTDEVEPLLRRALALQEKVFGRDARALVPTLRGLAAFLHEHKRTSESDQVLARAVAIEERSLREDGRSSRHPAG